MRVTAITNCECGLDPAEHDQPLVLMQHDYFMRGATIARLRKRLKPSEMASMYAFPWLLIDTVLTDEEVGR